MAIRPYIDRLTVLATISASTAALGAYLYPGGMMLFAIGTIVAGLATLMMIAEMYEIHRT